MAEPLPIEKIKIPQGRFGTARGDKHDESLPELARSIEEWGILEPVILDEDYTLIAGERRVIAAGLAGKEELAPDEYKLKSGLSELDKRRIELEENVQRKNLTWAEQARAVAEIHKIKKQEDPSWTLDKTAQLTGKSMGSVHSSVELDRELEKDPDLENKDTLRAALGEVRRKKKLKRRQNEARHRKVKGGGPTGEVLHGDALELIKSLPDDSIDAIVTNPPFGVDLAYDQGLRESRAPYEDDRDSVTDLMINICPEFYRVLKPNSWLVCFFATRKICLNSHVQDLVEYVKEHLDGNEELDRLAMRALGLRGWLLEAGFDWVQPTPSIWVKPNKTEGHMGNPDKPFVPAYESFLFAAKGSPSIVGDRPRNTTFTYDTPSSSERVHQVQMSRGLCKRLCELVVLGGELVLDPFCGSAAVGLGALDREADFLGFELDEEYAERGRMRLREHPAMGGEE